MFKKLKNTLYDMLSSDNSDTLSNARVQSFILFIIGIIMLILNWCGILTENVDIAYTVLGIGTGGGIAKSISSVITHKEEK